MVSTEGTRRNPVFCTMELTAYLWPKLGRRSRRIATPLVSIRTSQSEPAKPTVLATYMTKMWSLFIALVLNRQLYDSESFIDAAFNLKLISQLWKRKKLHQAELRAQHIAKHIHRLIHLTIHRGREGNLAATRRPPRGSFPGKLSLLQ